MYDLTLSPGEPSPDDVLDVDEVLASPTEAELEKGRVLGESIDIDDDDDAGDL